MPILHDSIIVGTANSDVPMSTIRTARHLCWLYRQNSGGLHRLGSSAKPRLWLPLTGVLEHSSHRVVTPGASTRRQHSPSCAGPAQSRHQVARPSGTASTVEAIGRPMPPSIGSSLPVCAVPADIGLRPQTHRGGQVQIRNPHAASNANVAREIFGYLCPRLALVGAAEISS